MYCQLTYTFNTYSGIGKQKGKLKNPKIKIPRENTLKENAFPPPFACQASPQTPLLLLVIAAGYAQSLW